MVFINKIIRIRNEVIDLYCQIAVWPAYAGICPRILHPISKVNRIMQIFNLVNNMLFSIAINALARYYQLEFRSLPIFNLICRCEIGRVVHSLRVPFLLSSYSGLHRYEL